MKEAVERKQKKSDEEKKKAEERAAKVEAAKRSGSTEPAVTPTSAKTEKNSPEAKVTSASGGTSAEPKTDAGPNVVYWVIVGVVVIAAAGIAWYFVRRKLFSHDIEQRYALYLSTLSYQQLRAKHGGNIELANNELQEHLRFIRGDIQASSEIAKLYPGADGKHTPLFESVQNLPLAITIRNDAEFIEYLKSSGTFL